MSSYTVVDEATSPEEYVRIRTRCLVHYMHPGRKST